MRIVIESPAEAGEGLLTLENCGDQGVMVSVRWERGVTSALFLLPVLRAAVIALEQADGYHGITPYDYTPNRGEQLLDIGTDERKSAE